MRKNKYKIKKKIVFKIDGQSRHSIPALQVGHRQPRPRARSMDRDGPFSPAQLLRRPRTSESSWGSPSSQVTEHYFIEAVRHTESEEVFDGDTDYARQQPVHYRRRASRRSSLPNPRQLPWYQGTYFRYNKKTTPKVPRWNSRLTSAEKQLRQTAFPLRTFESTIQYQTCPHQLHESPLQLRSISTVITNG